MTLILDISAEKKQKNYSMILLGSGPGFLQTILMLEGRDVLPLTNNDADCLTLERLGVNTLKIEFQTSALSFIKENSVKVILISSTTHNSQIIKAIQSLLRKDQVLIIVKYPKMKKISTHPYTYLIEAREQFDQNLWSRSMALCRYVKMQEFIKSKMPENSKKLKLLIIFFGSPDPDAIASSMAFSKLFSNMVTPTYASTAKALRFENRALLSYLKMTLKDLSIINVNDYHVIACMDSQPAFFIKSGFPVPIDICIDHHPEHPENPPTFMLDIRKNHGSCATILTQYFYYSKKVLPKKLATALLFGIKTDTANFTRSFYEPDANMMMFLYKKVDRQILKMFEFSRIPKRTLKYFKRAYSRYILDGSLLICHLGRVRYFDIGSIIAEHFLKIQGVHFTLVSCIYKDKLYAFSRSVGPLHNAGQIAAKLFEGYGVGGGHNDMGRSECLIQNLPFTVSEIENYLHTFLQSMNIDERKNERNT